MSFDPCPAGEFFWRIPVWWMRVPGVRHETLLTGALLLSYWQTHSKCSPGMSRLGKQLGLERRTIIRHLEHLQEVGILRVHKAPLSGPNADRVNTYEFLEHPAFKAPGGSDIAVTSDTGVTTGSDAPVTTVVTSLSPRVVTAVTGGSDTPVTQEDTEKSNQEDQREKKRARKARSPSPREREASNDPRVQAVAEHYRSKIGPGKGWKLEGRHNNKSRAVAVLEQLEAGYEVTDLCKAIDGYAGSSWHRESGETDLELICRKVEKGMQMAANPQTPRPGKTSTGRAANGGRAIAQTAEQIAADAAKPLPWGPS